MLFLVLFLTLKALMNCRINVNVSGMLYNKFLKVKVPNIKCVCVRERREKERERFLICSFCLFNKEVKTYFIKSYQKLYHQTQPTLILFTLIKDVISFTSNLQKLNCVLAIGSISFSNRPLFLSLNIQENLIMFITN